jgi:imidazolonepropionase
VTAAARWDALLTGCHLATMVPGAAPYGAITDAALAVAGGAIAWLGAAAALPPVPAAVTLDLGGAWVTPGLIDCHTHLVFAGDRAEEYERRLAGVDYAALARAGGGILATVRATRAADTTTLLDAAAARLARLRTEGVTTVEIKSGYGLELAAERRMLRVARGLGRGHGVDVVTTFLGAHAVPPEHRADRAAYVAEVAGPMLEALTAEGLVDAVDVFAEAIAFTTEECATILGAARARGLPVKAHADQLEDGGGAALAAAHGGLSADHLEHTGEAGVRAMAAAGTIAVLLPGAAYTLRSARRPPVDRFRAHGVPMAVATDANPGSSPLLSPLIAMHMACVLFGLTAEEALAGMTRHAAQALGRADRGVLRPGAVADLAVWRIGRPAELCYWLGAAPLAFTVKGGHRVTPGGSCVPLSPPAAPPRSPG